MKAIKVSDLKDQIGTPYPRPILKCLVCDNEYSANAGDYFMLPFNHVFKCCRRNMALMIKRAAFELVS